MARIIGIGKEKLEAIANSLNLHAEVKPAASGYTVRLYPIGYRFTYQTKKKTIDIRVCHHGWTAFIDSIYMAEPRVYIKAKNEIIRGALHWEKRRVLYQVIANYECNCDSEDRELYERGRKHTYSERLRRHAERNCASDQLHLSRERSSGN